MWPKQNPEFDLDSLLARIETARRIDPDRPTAILRGACPRLAATPAPTAEVDRLIKAEAWVELGLWLIAWELPDWSVHCLARDEARWSCSIGVNGIAVNWIEDVVEFQHDSLPLAVLGAFVQAQLRKARGGTPSNVAPFRRSERSPPPEPANPHQTTDDRT
jgi:hypothetical protein